MKQVGKRTYLHYDPITMGTIDIHSFRAIEQAIHHFIASDYCKAACVKHNIARDLPDVVSYEIASNGLYQITLSWCDDWHNKHEPAIVMSASYVVLSNDSVYSGNFFFKSLKTYKTNRQIFHGKHFFVSSEKDDFNRFDVNAEKERYEAYKKLNPDPLKMGREKWWKQWCKENNF